MTKVKKIRDCWWKKILVFTGLMVVLLVGYFVILKYVVLKRNDTNITADDFSFVFQVDAVQKDSRELVLDAWGFKLNEEATEGAMELWLYDLQEEKIIYPEETEYTRRLDVNEYFLCEYDYTDCGIVVSFDANKLSLEDKVYEVLVFDMYSKNVYQTGTYLSNGMLLYCLPEEYIPLEVAGTAIEEVVTKGVLRVYRPDFGMYVYQYEDDLYWIAELSYGFVDEDTIVQFQMNTTQIEKLSEHRLANNYFWSNLGFQFKSKELIGVDTGKYRVAKCALPTEYSITQIWTGNHINEWIWKQDFRPWYEFSE